MSLKHVETEALHNSFVVVAFRHKALYLCHAVSVTKLKSSLEKLEVKKRRILSKILGSVLKDGEYRR